jgi:hypothetical protein
MKSGPSSRSRTFINVDPPVSHDTVLVVHDGLRGELLYTGCNGTDGDGTPQIVIPFGIAIALV